MLLFAAAPVKESQTKLYLHVFSIMIANSRISDGDKHLAYLLLSEVIACRQHVCLICVLLALVTAPRRGLILDDFFISGSTTWIWKGQ